MADIYKAMRGSVAKSSDTSASFATMSPPLSGAGEILLLTQVQVQRNQATQYVKTLDDKIFGYAWGEAQGSITIQGTIFLGGCSGPSSKGISAVDGYYDKNNVYKNPKPVGISLGDKTFLGFLEQETILASASNENTGTFTFTLSILKPG